MQDSLSNGDALPRVGIVRLTPNIPQSELFARRCCYMGISLDNPVFNGSNLEALLSWATRNFERCLVVVGDYLRRFNEQIVNGLDGDDAIRACERDGEAFVSRRRALFERFGSEKLQLTRWKPCLQTMQFIESKAILDKLFGTEPGFAAAVEADAVSFVERLTKRNHSLAVEPERAVEFSCQYLLEEMAVFSALSEQGWTVELYPGPELSALVEIADGRYASIPLGLKKRVNVELRVHRVKRP